MLQISLSYSAISNPISQPMLTINFPKVCNYEPLPTPTQGIKKWSTTAALIRSHKTPAGSPVFSFSAGPAFKPVLQLKHTWQGSTHCHLHASTRTQVLHITKRASLLKLPCAWGKGRLATYLQGLWLCHGGCRHLTIVFPFSPPSPHSSSDKEMWLQAPSCMTNFQPHFIISASSFFLNFFFTLLIFFFYLFSFSSANVQRLCLIN